VLERAKVVLERRDLGLARGARRHGRAGVTRELNGHYGYFGVNGNFDSLKRVHFAVERAWPEIKVQIWGNRESVRQKSRMV
jgi:hypothetical protein